MKKYDATIRKYVEETQGTLKKPKVCKGGKPHDFQPVLPSMVKTTKDVTPQMIDAYYGSELRRTEYLASEDAKLNEIGIVSNLRFWRNEVHIHVECARCGKKDYWIKKKL